MIGCIKNKEERMICFEKEKSNFLTNDNSQFDVVAMLVTSI